MKAVVQRVSKASVTIDGKIVAAIQKGVLVLLGIEAEDTEDDIHWLSKKIANLRIFNDQNGVMNTSLIDENGDCIVVSQFTLYASTKKGNRPSYIKAARPIIAIPLYEKFIDQFQQELGKEIQSGQFGAEMMLEIFNEGPVTIIIDTKNKI
ncbi:MAG: D-aminoacyl-tRNA deacylase [Flavobacterium sp. SCGC AAA160-P02]|nr:MAG: D-aminoacyl-tRNA deacylase [Flavobacterium sp. SCGC AAA160-P02]